MNATTIVIIAFFATAIIMAIAMGIWLFTKNRRTKELRSKFGPEYNRMARSEGDAARAEHLLQERQKRVKKLDITPLTDRQRHDFADKWEHAQARFVDDPAAAVADPELSLGPRHRHSSRARGCRDREAQRSHDSLSRVVC